VAELIHGLDGLAQGQVAGQHDVRAVQGDDEGALDGPRPDPEMAVSAAMMSSSGMPRRASRSSWPSATRLARSRSVAIFRQDSPAVRSSPGSTASSSPAAGRLPPKSAWMRAMIRRVAFTDSCCPVTWNRSAP
jgi:hypothetical protein